MIGVIIGFAIIALIVFVGWVVARFGLIGENGEPVLARLTFFVLTPALLLTVVAGADVEVLFTAFVPVSIIAAVSSVVIAAVVAGAVWRRGVAATTLVALASGSVNANNIGIPIALYVLGDASLAAPILLINLMLFTPIALALLDASATGTFSLRRVVLQPVTNPIIIATVLGLVLAITQPPIPDIFLEPFRVVGAAAVPISLLVFGMSLHGARLLAAGTSHRDVWLVFVLKMILMPTIAWVFGALVFGLSGMSLFAVVVLAALPSALNVYVWALRYRQQTSVARDSVLLTTLAALPVMIIIALVLSPR